MAEVSSYDTPLPQAKVVLIDPWRRALLDKSTITQLIKKSLTFHGTCKIIAVFTTAHHWMLTYTT
jgi:hypothetical protein